MSGVAAVEFLVACSSCEKITLTTQAVETLTACKKSPFRLFLTTMYKTFQASE